MVVHLIGLGPMKVLAYRVEHKRPHAVCRLALSCSRNRVRRFALTSASAPTKIAFSWVIDQIWLLIRQNQIIGKQNEIMEGQRTAANTQSGYMRDGLLETRKSTDAAKLTADVAERAMRSSDRPYLRVGSFAISNFAPGATNPGLECNITNAWNTPATLLETGCRLWAGKRCQPNPATQHHHRKAKRMSLRTRTPSGGASSNPSSTDGTWNARLPLSSWNPQAPESQKT